MTALIADEADANTRGTASGIFMAVFSLGMVAGTSSAGALTWLQQAIGLHPFWFAALLMALDVALAASVWLGRRRQ